MQKKISKKTYDFLIFLDKSPIALIIFTEIIFGAILSISSLLLFAKITEKVVQNSFTFYDITISNFIYSYRNAELTKIMEFISFLGQTPVILFSIFIIIYLLFRKHKEESLLFFFLMTLGFVINSLLKIIIARPRPLISPIVIETSYSFPSSHVMNSFVFYIALSFFVFRFTRNKKLTAVVFFFSIFLILLIALSRVYLGVHYPSDVFAGFIAGFWWLATALLIEKTILFRKILRESKN